MDESFIAASTHQVAIKHQSEPDPHDRLVERHARRVWGGIELGNAWEMVMLSRRTRGVVLEVGKDGGLESRHLILVEEGPNLGAVRTVGNPQTDLCPTGDSKCERVQVCHATRLNGCSRVRASESDGDGEQCINGPRETHDYR